MCVRGPSLRGPSQDKKPTVEQMQQCLKLSWTPDKEFDIPTAVKYLTNFQNDMSKPMKYEEKDLAGRTVEAGTAARTRDSCSDAGRA